MVSDFKAAEMFRERYPKRFIAIRYEELSLDPFTKTREIFNFYGLPFHEDVELFLKTHTHKYNGDIYSTFRDSKRTPYHWMHELSFNETKQIQSQCTEAMELWGYRIAVDEDEHDLLENKFDPLLKFPVALTD